MSRSWPHRAAAALFSLGFLQAVSAVDEPAADRASWPTVAAVQWGSQPASTAGPAGRPQPHIKGLTVHHQGEIWRLGADVPDYLRRLQQWSRRTKFWVDLPYHYVISPDGTVFEGRPIEWAGDSNTDYDTTGQVQVMLLGNFEEQQPTRAQWDSTAQLLARLMDTHSLPPQSILAHRHHTGQTVCPGTHLMATFEDLRQAAQLLRVAPVSR